MIGFVFGHLVDMECVWNVKGCYVNKLPDLKVAYALSKTGLRDEEIAQYLINKGYTVYTSTEDIRND